MTRRTSVIGACSSKKRRSVSRNSDAPRTGELGELEGHLNRLRSTARISAGVGIELLHHAGTPRSGRPRRRASDAGGTSCSPRSARLRSSASRCREPERPPPRLGILPVDLRLDEVVSDVGVPIVDRRRRGEFEGFGDSVSGRSQPMPYMCVSIPPFTSPRGVFISIGANMRREGPSSLVSARGTASVP